MNSQPNPSIPFNPEVIPAELRAAPNWVMWRFEERDGKITKPPFQTNGQYARANASSTWTTFSAALACLNAGGYDGIGIEPTGIERDGKPLITIDLDGLRGDHPYVRSLLEILGNPWAETTPSGNGVRTFAFAHLPPSAFPPESRRKFMRSKPEKFGAEITVSNESGHYYTITSSVLPQSGKTIPAIEDFSLPYFLLSHILNDSFTSLWTGSLEGYDGDQSRADLALAGLLVRLLNGDAETAEKWFAYSALGQRDKWKREDYRKRTFEKAAKPLESGVKFGSQAIPSRSPSPSPAPSFSSVLETAASIQEKKIRWLWPNRIAMKLNLLVGNPDVAKSLISLDIAARVTTGQPWFDGENSVPPSEVLILAGEDDWGDIIRPRLRAAGADLTKVYRMRMLAVSNETQLEREIQLDRDCAELEARLIEHPEIRLVIVDPVSNYLGMQTKMVDEQAVRAVLTPLKEIAHKRNVAIIGILHLNKKVDLDAIHRISGAMAFVGVARMVWLCAPKPQIEEGEAKNDKDDKDGKDGKDDKDDDELLMVKVKGNIVQRKVAGLSYIAKARKLEVEGSDEWVPYIEWRGIVAKSADDLETKGKAAHRPADRLMAATAWLREALKNGPRLLSELLTTGETNHALSRNTLLRARRVLGIRTFLAEDSQQRMVHHCELPTHEEETVL